jgi:hypothetical protein
MTPDTWTVYIEVTRDFFEDEPACHAYMERIWLDGLRYAGGEPMDGGPTIQTGPKKRNGEEISWGGDETSWDTIMMRATGGAMRPDTG